MFVVDLFSVKVTFVLTIRTSKETRGSAKRRLRMDLNIRGKVAIVTGAGRGIGRAISLTFAEEGAWVVVNDIDSSVAEEVAKEIVSRGFRVH